MKSFRQDRSIDPFYMILLQVSVLFVCSLAVLLYLPDPVHFIQDNDWGLQLAGANQILGGEHPFIDFPIYYGPLTPYASALAQFLFHGRPLAELILVLTGYTFAYFLLFNLFRQISGDLTISLLMLCVSLLLIPRMYKYYIVLCPVLVMSALFCYVKSPDRLKLLLLSFLVVVTGLFRQDYGVYALLTCSFVLLLRPLEGRGLLLSLVWFWSAVLFFAMPWLLFLIFRGGLVNYLLISIFQTPRAIMSIASPFSFKGMTGSDIFTDFPLLLFLVSQSLPAIGLTMLLAGRKQIDRVRRIQLGALIFFTQFSLIQWMHRQDYQHTLQAIPLALVLYCWLVSISRKALYSSSQMKKIAGGVALCIFSGIGIYCIQYNTGDAKRFRDMAQISELPADYRVFAQARRLFVESVVAQIPKSVQIRTLQYIDECTKPEERIIAYVRLASLYYFSDRMFGGGIMSLNPGLLTPGQEDEVIAKIEKQKPVLFIDNPRFNYGIGDNGVFGTYAPLLHHFLVENFVTVNRWGQRTVGVNRQYLGSLPGKCLIGGK